MKSYYTPTPPSADTGAWTFRELQRVASVTQQDSLLAKRTVAPTAPQDGQVEYADGTAWNPGSGEGAYIYYAAAWHKLG